MPDNIQAVVEEVRNIRPEDLRSRFVAADVDLLGAGIFSEVYAYRWCAVKLGGDPGGLVYARWCRDNQHLEAVPVMHYFKEFKDATFVVVMEVLRPHNHEEFYYRYADHIRGMSLYDRIPDLIPEYISEFVDGFKEIRAHGVMDLHPGNYMVRGVGGAMVIIDPFSGVPLHGGQQDWRIIV